MFDLLSSRLQNLWGKGKPKTLSAETLPDTIRDIRRALIEADVSLRAIKRFLGRVEERAIGEAIVPGVNAQQTFTHIVHQELAALLGGEHQPLQLERPAPNTPAVLMLFGVQGSGKTTTAAKLAAKLNKESHKEGYKPLLVAADVYRPAAIDQLQTLGKRIEVPVFTLPGEQNVQKIVSQAVAYAQAENLSPVIVDTAGRLQVDHEMMAELLLLERRFKPQEKLLVLDAMTGQEALRVAEAFHTQLSITGMILTKLDGDARGGAALSVVELTGQPIRFVGTGEKAQADTLEAFHPDRMAGRILGMGDVVSLVEKAQAVYDEKQTGDLMGRLFSGQFSIDDYLGMQKQLRMLGSLGGILDMLPIPGLSKELKATLSGKTEQQGQQVHAMASSMTPQERRKPELLNPSRIRRIAKGCGQSQREVEAFLKQFNQMRMMMGQLSGMMGGMTSGNETAAALDNSPASTLPAKTGADWQAFGMGRRAPKKQKSLFPGMPPFPHFPQ